jgi:hypothetical protein
MLVFDGNSKPVIFDSIHAPTDVDYFWVLDLALMDFTLTPLATLEETISPTMVVEVGGFQFELPTNWNIVVYHRDTSQIDVVSIGETAGHQFTAFTYGPSKAKPTPSLITVVNYFPGKSCVGPLLNKHQMLCHPISADEWVMVSPNDSYNKYLKNCVVGDII